MNNYRFVLDKSSKKYRCPQCEKRSLVQYTDTEKNINIDESFGRCDRVNSCGYFKDPYTTGYAKEVWKLEQGLLAKDYKSKNTYVHDNKIEVLKSTSFIPDVYLMKSIELNKQGNNFITFLLSHFDNDTVNELATKYLIGGSKKWVGATTFWQVDIEDNIRTGKIILYNALTGKRVKEPYSKIAWEHTAIESFELEQTWFGSHLLIDASKPIAIFESEKCAVVASLFFKKYICISAGGADGINKNKLNELTGMNVILFPDLGQEKAWQVAAKKLVGIVNSIGVSDILEKRATEEQRKSGLDIADFLLGEYKLERLEKGLIKPPVKLELKPAIIPSNPVIHTPADETTIRFSSNPIPLIKSKYVSFHKYAWFDKMHKEIIYYKGRSYAKDDKKILDRIIEDEQHSLSSKS